MRRNVKTELLGVNTVILIELKGERNVYIRRRLLYKILL